MPKYSIITPQYNSFDLMEKYFDSLENQTYKDFEVIIVDDCSTDGSYEKLQEKVKSSPLLITLKQAEKNSGPGNARNIGLDSAKGEWVTFIDNDDWVVYDMLERVDRVIELETVNCVIYDYYTYRDGKTGIAKSMYIGEGGRKTVSDCADEREPNRRRCEDVAYVCQAIDACVSAYYLNEPLYYYWQRPTSLSNNKKMDETGILQAFSILEEKLGPKYPVEMKQRSV